MTAKHPNVKRPALSELAEQIIHQLVVVDGRSYDDAVEVAEQRAKRAAAPYLEVAAEVRRWIADLDERARYRASRGS